MIKKILSTCAAVTVCASAASAAVLIEAEEVGSDVVFTLSGSFNTAGLQTTRASNTLALFSGDFGSILFGDRAGNGLDAYVFPTFPVFASASSFGVGTGDTFQIFTSNTVGVEAGYSGGPLSAALTIPGSSFLILGLTDGISLTSTGANGETITLNIGNVASVPLPAGGALLVAGLGAFAAARKRKAA